MANFTFICGSDDFLVNQKGKALFNQKSAALADDLSKEVIDGGAQNVGEVDAIVSQFQSAVQTLSLFGENKVVWLKGASFLGDNVTARAQGTKDRVADLQAILETVDPSAVTIIITASPVDRRTREFKWFQKASDCTFIESEGGAANLQGLADEICKPFGVSIRTETLELLSSKVGGHTRLILEEVKKLATYLGKDGGEIDSKLIYELVPDFGSGDFFEAVEAFYSRDLSWTLKAIGNYFFSQKESRPLLASFQSRNRLMIQLRVLLDSGDISLGYRGLDKNAFEHAKTSYVKRFGDFETKSAFNVFTQNVWYLGKLAQSAKALPLKKLIQFQLAFVKTFETILERPTEQEAVIRELAIECLGAA